MTTKSLVIIWTCILTACVDNTATNRTVTSNEVKLTVIKTDNQNPGFGSKTDTLLLEQPVDLKVDKIDVFYCFNNFRLPYYMPTNGIYKDSVKDKECNWKDYPSTVKCYEYDDKNRVIKMQVEGSGTTGWHTFKYGDNDKIIEIQSQGDRYEMTYDKVGNLIKMTVIGSTVQKQLAFIYELK